MAAGDLYCKFKELTLGTANLAGHVPFLMRALCAVLPSSCPFLEVCAACCLNVLPSGTLGTVFWLVFMCVI